MTATTRHHRVIQHALANGQHDHINCSLTDGVLRIRSSRRYADVFHTYEFTDRVGTRLHVAYAHYRPGSSKHGFGMSNPPVDITYVYETTAEAVAAKFGFSAGGQPMTGPEFAQAHAEKCRALPRP
ncbi:hypothetical protein [Streptomyces sp. NRRL F-5065]|uniref:hypothetical protein n=1 Tax=Streptomyces sp. NRRL F-5065 TaxID=1463855 RepID=UPI0004C0ADA4|nr:hypothetical protein [Streptomyces sp. NRRL F-5065]